MPRLVIDARESGTSTGRYIDKLIEYLAKLRPAFEVVILTKSQRLDFIKRIAPNLKVVKSDYKEFSLAEQVGFARQLYSLKPDLVHFSMTHQPVFYFGRSVTTVHDLTTARFRNPAKNWLVFWLKQQVYRAVIVWVAHKSKIIFTPTEWVRNDLARFAHVKPGKITVTCEAADKVDVASQPIDGLTPREFIGYVGRSLPHKNLARLVEAFSLIKKKNPQLKLVLAGKKDVLYKQMEAMAPPGVIFPGFITDGQWRWLFENTAVYVFPSLSEGFGLPGLEAMLYEVPVAASSATCLPELYGEAAVYFNPTDTADMADKIDKLLSDKDLRTKMIGLGKKQAAKYSWSKMASQTLKVYKKYIQ